MHALARVATVPTAHASHDSLATTAKLAFASAGTNAHTVAAPSDAKNNVNNKTSRLSQDRRHIFSARHAYAGRPRCMLEVASAIAVMQSRIESPRAVGVLLR